MTPDLPIGPVLGALDLIGIAVFAATGAVAAARAGQTVVTFVFFALATGMGGGTIRDLLIGAPVFWVVDSRSLLACLVIAFAVWATRRGCGAARRSTGSMRSGLPLMRCSALPRR